MPSIDLNTVAPAELQHLLSTRSNIVACLCAAWCDVCQAWRPRFESLSLHHPEMLFVWIDIEDQDGLVGDLDIDNFPTMLLQQGDSVRFFGTIQPDTTQLTRLVQTRLIQPDPAAAHQEAWQIQANLRARIARHV